MKQEKNSIKQLRGMICVQPTQMKGKKQKSRMSKKSREDNNEEDDMAFNRSKKTYFKRIRQYLDSGSEDEMANSPVPPKPPAIALANSKLSSPSQITVLYFYFIFVN
jgi:hypothetical protein